MDLDAETLRPDGEGVEEDLIDGGRRLEEVAAIDAAPGEEVGTTGKNATGDGHAAHALGWNMTEDARAVGRIPENTRADSSPDADEWCNVV